jgi:hypothetical protein
MCVFCAVGIEALMYGCYEFLSFCVDGKISDFVFFNDLCALSTACISSMIETVACNGASCVVSPVLLVCLSITVVVMTYINVFLQGFVCGNTVAGQVLYSMDRIEDSIVCYNQVMLGREHLIVF